MFVSLRIALGMAGDHAAAEWSYALGLGYMILDAETFYGQRVVVGNAYIGLIVLDWID